MEAKHENQQVRYRRCAHFRRGGLLDLVIHGSDDESVPAAEAERLADAGPHETTRLELIENTGHTFDAVHPFAGTTPALERVIGLSADWFERKLEENGRSRKA